MASYIITFRLSGSDKPYAYKKRRDDIYDYFDGYIPLRKSDDEEENGEKKKERTTSTLFWQSGDTFIDYEIIGRRKLVSGGIVYKVGKGILNKDDELLFIKLEEGFVDEVIRAVDGRVAIETGLTEILWESQIMLPDIPFDRKVRYFRYKD